MFFISLFTFYVIISVIYLTFTALFFLCRALLMVFVWHVLCQCDIIGYVGCRGRFWWTL